MNRVKGILDDPLKQEYATKLTLMSVFLSVFGLFVSKVSGVRQEKRGLKIAPFDLAMLGLSALRLGRMVAYDRIAEPIRHPFTETRPDPTGAGETVEPRGQGMRNSLGQLLCCPICVGTWISAGLVYFLQIFPNATRVFLSIMSTIGLAEILNALTEALSWIGQLSRTLAGSAGNRPNESISTLFNSTGGKYYVGHDHEEYYRQSGR